MYVCALFFSVYFRQRFFLCRDKAFEGSSKSYESFSKGGALSPRKLSQLVLVGKEADLVVVAFRLCFLRSRRCRCRPRRCRLFLPLREEVRHHAAEKWACSQ